MSSSGPSRLSRLIPSRFRNRSSLTNPASSSPNPVAASNTTSAAVTEATTVSTTVTTPADSCPQGLEIVAEGTDPVVDIVAVHGLNGHREKTWIAGNGVHWLRDLLPSDIPNARVFCWGYDARTHASSGVSCQYLYDHARSLISDLCRKRKLSQSMERPIIFVAHSLGGIIVKSALIHSDAARRGALEEQRSIKVSTYGVMFLGTPHQGGSGVQFGKLLVNIASLFVAADNRLLKHLEQDSEWLQQQLGQYGPIGGDFVTKFAYEVYETPTAFGHTIMLKVLKDGLDILASSSNRQSLENDHDAITLANELDGLPLALSTAGAYLKNVSTSFSQYLAMYRDSWLCLQRKTQDLLSHEDRSLYSTWDISYKQIMRQNGNSAMLLVFWAYFDNQDLWFELLQQGLRTGPPCFRQVACDAFSFNEVVRVLCEYGFVEPDTSLRESSTESRGYSMHNCVHMWTLHALNETRDIEMARLAMQCVGSHVPADTERNYWVVQRLMRHADRCLEMQIGRLDEAEAMHDRALKDEEKALGPDHPSTLGTVSNLGGVYLNQGRLDEAGAMFDRALKGFEKALGLNHLSTLDAASNLGSVYLAQGRLDEAEAMFDRALKGFEKALGPNNPSTLDTVNNLGALYSDQGRLDEAEAMYDRAREGYEETLGPDHPSTLDVVNRIGLLYSDQDR